MDRSQVAQWISAYERSWRTAGTDGLRQLFTPDVSYLPSPWARPIHGVNDLAPFWEAGRDGPDEAFSMTSEIIAVDGDTAVVRLAVDYASTGERWRDLWVLRFAADGRCVAFEEWPFAPDQPDGQP